jgi:hypothetical protein
VYGVVSLQLFTQVEAFSSAISKLQELGLSVNVEESELVYRGTAGAWGKPAAVCRSVSCAWCGTTTWGHRSSSTDPTALVSPCM